MKNHESEIPQLSVLLILAACFSFDAAAQADESTPASQGSVMSQPAEADTAIEEITVVGQRQILTLRHQLDLAEDRAFDIFNKLNDDDSYDIHCRDEAKTGTLIRRRTCLPNFYHDATANEASLFLSQIGEYSTYSTAVPSAKGVFAHKFPIFKEKVKALALKNPELKDAMQEIFDLTAELNQKRAAYHDTDE